VALFDHEEVGSGSYNGAGSSLLVDTLTLINESLADGSSGTLLRSLRHSLLVSVDMSHALHPNYPSKHDSSMAPVFNGGTVIKHNANQRYATNSVSASIMREAARVAAVPVQEFTVRADSGCGSTIGPILSTLSGILTVDCGSPQLSMHSIRESMAAADAHSGYALMRSVLANHPNLAAAFL
jgi:aspartyl aminopeptidase